jgi:thiosulfate dehydrogenase
MGTKYSVKLLLLSVLLAVSYFSCRPDVTENKNVRGTTVKYWMAPDTASISYEPTAEQIRYGKKLLENTSYYFGPKGKVAAISNGLNCQNCHLQAGTKLYGNNFGAVASEYPRFRPRSGKIETISSRINECLQRSLNGSVIDTNSKEMLAMVAYITWLSKNVQKGQKIEGTGGTELPFMNRSANCDSGKEVFEKKCAICHGTNGSGVMNSTGSGYQYPPLWGSSSYNTGAGMLRLVKLAGFVKTNMPLGTTYTNPQLTDEEAWDVAAYIDSQPRPDFDRSKDYPDISNKPVDYPFGPYSDNFTETQHKYGPFKPIAQAIKKKPI